MPLVATVLCAALVGGCGDSRAPLAGGGASDKERFVASGDKLCRQLAARFPRVRADLRKQSPAARLKAASAYREFTRQLSSGLVQLEAPADPTAKQIVATSVRLASAARAQTTSEKRVAGATERGDVKAAFREALRSVRAEQRMTRDIAEPLDASMRRYGFRVCGDQQAFGAKEATSRTRS
ncbi:MAG TPA: hypothetical protein VGO80_00210 [Solirubrobacteraceae bacterium]|nr:hypothetical protein [Solirubrobacteraceae bacterium]